MAENKEEKQSKAKVIYNLGDKQLDLEQYIYNLGINVKGYMDSQNWNEGQRQEFMDSYNKYIEGLKEQLIKGTNRFSSDNFGRITDNDGILGDKDNDGIDENGSEYYYDDKGNQIKTSDYNALKDKDKKKYNTFSANRKVAAYLEKVGRKLSEYSEKKETPQTTKFNLNDHGFMKYWSNAVAPSGDFDFRLILDMDAPDEVTKKRPRTKRLEYLKGQLNDYINHIKTSNYDFSESPFKTSEAYLSLLNTLYRNMNDNIWNTSDIMDASRAGISTKFSNIFFTEEENPEITPEQQNTILKTKAQEDRKKEIEEAWNKEKARWVDMHKAYVSGLNGNYRTYNNNPLRLDPTNKGEYYIINGKFDSGKWTESFTNDKDQTYSKIINNLEQEGMQNVHDYLNLIFSDPYNHRKELPRALHYLISNGQYAVKLDNGSYYIKRPTDQSTGSVLIYDPASNSVYESFIGQIPQYWNQIRQRFLETNYPDEYIYKKEGGTLQKFQTGGNIFGDDVAYFLEDNYEQQLKENAKKSGRTVEEQKAGERKVGTPVNEAQKTILDPNAGFSRTDRVRLATIGADIVSAVASFFPGYGSIIGGGAGLLSTLGTFGADVAEDGFQWGDLGNLATNVGLDILGVIPHWGTGSKLAKITKTLGKFVPRILAAVSVSQTLENKDNIIASFNKLMDTPKELTVDDWRNISEGIGFTTGVSGAISRKAWQQLKNKPEAQVKNTVALEVVDKNNNRKVVAFEGDDAKEIIRAKESGDIDGIRNVTVKKYEDLREWDIATGTRPQARLPWENGKLALPWKSVETSPSIYDVYKDSKGRTYIDNEWYRNNQPGKKYGITDTYDNSKYTIDDYTKMMEDANKQRIDKMLEGSKREVQKKEKADKFLTDQKTKMDDIESKIGGRKSADIQTEINEINTRRNTPEYKSRLKEYTKTSKEIKKYTKDKNKLKKILKDHEAYGKPLIDPESGKKTTKDKINARIKALDDLINNQTQSLDNNKAYIEGNSDSRLTDLQTQFTTVEGLEKELARYSTRRQRIQDAYNRRWKTSNDKIFPVSKEYREYVDRYTNSDGNIDWRDPDTRDFKSMTVDEFNEMLKKAGIIFKEGGSLNINRVRSYQNASGGGIKLNTEVQNYSNDVKLSPSTFQFLLKNGVLDIPELNFTTSLTKPNAGGQNTPDKKGSVTTPDGDQDSDDDNVDTKKQTFNFEEFLRNPNIKYGLPRILYADLVNKKLTDMAINAEKPFLATPMTVNKTVHGDLNAEIRSEKAAAQLRNMASQPRTSDASLNTAVQLEAELKGQDFINQGLKASDEVRRTTSEQAWQQEKENAQMRNNIANANQMSMLKTQSNIAKHQMAEESKKYSNWETLSKQLEHNELAEIDKNKAYEEAFIKKDISNYVTNNLTELAPELEPEAIQIYQQVQLGALTPSEVQKDANKWDLFMKATKIAQELESDQLRESKNIPKSKWSNSRKLAIQKEYEILIKEYTGQGLSFEQADQKAREQLTAQKRDGGIIEAKDGSKIEVARIKARTKNAELFQKQIKDSIDRNEKVLDRLSKSLYGYVKASIK